MLRISSELVEEIGRRAKAAYPHECCGILIGRIAGDGVEVIESREAKNVAEEGRLKDRYSVDPLAIVRGDREAAERGLEIVGYYHSHPDHAARPSATDTSQAWEGYVYVIISATREAIVEVRAWRLVAGAFVEEELICED